MGAPNALYIDIYIECIAAFWRAQVPRLSLVSRLMTVVVVVLLFGSWLLSGMVSSVLLILNVSCLIIVCFWKMIKVTLKLLH